MLRAELRPTVLGPAPCDECPRADLCARQLLACEAYAAFVWYDVDVSWRGRTRNPNHHLYERIFRE